MASGFGGTTGGVVASTGTYGLKDAWGRSYGDKDYGKSPDQVAASSGSTSSSSGAKTYYNQAGQAYTGDQSVASQNGYYYTSPPQTYSSATGGYTDAQGATTQAAPNYTASNAGGGLQISQSAYENEASLRLQAELQAQAEARRLGYLSSVTGESSTIERGDVDTGAEGEARAAAFARAKETAGQNATASLQALRSVMENSGTMGSSTEALGTGAAIGGAGGAVNDFVREQLIQDLERAAQLSDQEYQGKITQRGQDLSAYNSVLGLLTSSAY